MTTSRSSGPIRPSSLVWTHTLIASTTKGGVDTQLDAVGPGEIPLEEAGQAVGAVTDGAWGDDGVAQEGLGLGVLQE